MNRIFKRPMFRKGGTPNEGIMSGLKEPRKGFFAGSPPPGGGVVPGDILTRGGGVMKPSVSSPMSTASRFYPPVTTTPAGPPATIPKGGLPSVISPTGEKVDFMRRLGRGVGSIGRGIGPLIRSVPGLATLAATMSGPAIIAKMNAPETLEELQVMKGIDPETGEVEDIFGSGLALDETMSAEDIADFEKRRAEAREDGTPIGTGDTGLFSSKEDIQKAIEEAKEEGPPPPPPPPKNDGLGEMGTSDFEKSLNEYLPAIESALQIDDDATRRQLFLQLAKFGAGLAAQPGGDLVGAIGRAAQKPLEGVSRVLSDQQAAKRQAKLIAVQAAIKDLGPGSYGKNINDIMKTFNLKGVEGRKIAGAMYNKILANDNTALSRDQQDLKKVAREDLRLKGGATDAYVANVRYMRENYPELIGKFNKVAQPEDKLTDKEYYVTPEGSFVRYIKETDEFVRPGEPGFTDIKKKK